MGQGDIIFKKLGLHERTDYAKYLLLADEDENIVNGYLLEGEMFSIRIQGKLAGAILFVFQDETVELKNIALLPESRGKGIGKEIMRFFIQHYRKEGYLKMEVGTANSSIGNIAFYQKAGFRISRIVKDFFLQYGERIFENGIQAVDMIMFERKL
ncbi:GNAT family N-acetyltransferase [Peribacillus deserti]|uniref:GNAT family N-acetyltransferase n=2 Tax=Peribacillus deserti TaxID=673318 RepID=A0A2N5M235_9BACI|nr:GNAT family N-acetyltransferase [Peribacillus deserti]